MYIQIGRYQLEMAISIQQTASEIRDDTKVSIYVPWLVTETELIETESGHRTFTSLREG